MKRTLVLLGFVGLLSACASAPPSGPTATGSATPAPVVQQYKEVILEEAFPSLVKSYDSFGDLSSTVTSKYNENGRLVWQETLNANGLVSETRTGAAKGTIWRLTVMNGQSGEIVSLEDRTYSNDGELLSQTFMTPKEIPQTSNEYLYKDGKKIQWLAKTGADTLQAKTLYLYDKDGNNYRTEVYDAGGKLMNTFESLFNESGKIISRKGFDNKGELIEQTNFVWNGDQKMKEETVKPLLRTIDYTYGNKNVPSGVTSSVRGKIVEKQTIDYFWTKKIKKVAVQ